MANAIVRNIPNTLTSCNLFSGCIAAYMAFHGNYKEALLFIVLGAMFDFFDGMTARLLHVSSPIGKELDSLADDITFGLAPAAIAFSLVKDVYERQTSSFIGMPTPANALFWASLAVGGHSFLISDNFNAIYLFVLVVVMSLLLVAELPMFSLKFKDLSWGHNKISYIFLIVSLPLLIIFQLSGIAAVIIWYILLSLATRKK